MRPKQLTSIPDDLHQFLTELGKEDAELTLQLLARVDANLIKAGAVFPDQFLLDVAAAMRLFACEVQGLSFHCDVGMSDGITAINAMLHMVYTDLKLAYAQGSPFGRLKVSTGTTLITSTSPR